MTAGVHPTWPSPDGQEVRRFLKVLGKPKGASRLRAFFPSGDGRKTEDRGRKDLGDPALIKQWQAEGRGIYIVINDGGDTDAEITSCRALFCEWDDRPMEWQVQAWRELGLPEPTIQVATGGKSVHNYWVLSEPLPPEQWRGLQQRLLEHADADRSLKNPSRVMRLPGCWYMHPNNQPGELVQIVHESGQRYSAAELEACLPELPSPQLTAALIPQDLRPGQGVPLTQLLPRDLEQLAEQGAQEGSRNDDCFRLAAGALAIAEAATTAGLQADGTPEQVVLAFAARCSPPLSEREALACLRSAESETRSPDPGWPERLRYQLNQQARLRQAVDQLAASEAKGGSDAKAQPQQKPATKQQSPDPTTAAEKIADLRELAAQLQADRVGFAERLPTLRHRAGQLDLTIRDSELQGLLAAARRRRLGVDGLLGPGAVLDMSPEPWAWNGLLLRGCLNLLIALPKQGKTSLLVSLIGAWHHGAQTFLNQQLIGPCPPVLLIGTDQGQADWGRMLQPAGLVDESGRILQPIVGLAHSGRPLHLDPEGIDLIAEKAQQHPGLLVVIDSLSACIAPLGLKEESPEIAMPVAELMEQLEPHGATVVLIHHASKGRAGDGASSASRGSTALPALASQILKLAPATPNDPRDNRRLLTTEGRGGAPQALVIERQGCTWHLHGGIGELERERQHAAAVKKLTDRQAAALQVLQDRWVHQLQTTAADLVAALELSGAAPQDAARQTLTQLEQKGLAESSRNQGAFGRRGANAYRPTKEMFEPPSRGADQKHLVSLVCLGSEGPAREDPERSISPLSSVHPTSETKETKEAKEQSPARGGGNVSFVASALNPLPSAPDQEGAA